MWNYLFFSPCNRTNNSPFVTELMAFEQNFQQNWKTVSAPTTASENVNGCFECNICLDSARDPVVTLCGHLYCWPCIYKWLHVQSSSPESDNQSNCPVCKANISKSSLVPLYGRGNSPPESKKPPLDLAIPSRPPPLGSNTLLTTTPTSGSTNPSAPFQPNPFQPHSFYHQQYLPGPIMGPPNFGGGPMSNLFSPTVGMFGEMVFARMFGGTDANLLTYPFPNTYMPIAGIDSPRVRRQEMQVDKSLSRVSIFLLCCFVLCLLLFWAVFFCSLSYCIICTNLSTFRYRLDLYYALEIFFWAKDLLMGCRFSPYTWDF